MNNSVTRRDMMRTLSGLGLVAGSMAAMPTSAFCSEPAPATALWPEFPRQNAKLVAEVVGQAHSNEARVRQLVGDHPALVNAWWDWGFGDWESPLGAASHVCQRGIAEFLLEKGARIDIFAAAMLGYTDVVRAFVVARPSIQRTLGPHGIPLLAHARAGGEKAKETLAYLESLGDAGAGIAVTPLPTEHKNALAGQYRSDETDVRVECRVNRNGLFEARLQVGKEVVPPRILHYMGNDEFFPAGVPSVRFRFELENGTAKAVTIHANSPILTAKRV